MSVWFHALLSSRDLIVQTFVAVIQICSERITLLFPKDICRFIIFKHQSEYLLYAFLL